MRAVEERPHLGERRALMSKLRQAECRPVFCVICGNCGYRLDAAAEGFSVAIGKPSLSIALKSLRQRRFSGRAEEISWCLARPA